MLPCRLASRRSSALAYCAEHVITPSTSLVFRRHLERRKYATSTTDFQKSGSDTPKTIFSGIQPTGIPHLGNYLGALKQWRQLQDEASRDDKLVFSLVDLHAITVKQDPAQLRQWRTESLAMLLAIGLDPARCIIFHQSDVPAHSQLMWILSCQASTGYLGRMTQWKDKTALERDSNAEKPKLGLFSYPVLMAADILVHRATHVPVGHDQVQHLEFTRELANGFNASVGSEVLTVPEIVISPAKRIMSLTEPTKKMSKSHDNPKSRILLTDSDEEIRVKIGSALTDSQDGISYDPANRPGVGNLLDILFHSAARHGFDTPQQLADDMTGLHMRAVKARVTAGVQDVVRPIRERYAMIINDEHKLRDVRDRGRSAARTHAQGAMKDVLEALGLDQE